LQLPSAFSLHQRGACAVLLNWRTATANDVRLRALLSLFDLASSVRSSRQVEGRRIEGGRSHEDESLRELLYERLDVQQDEPVLQYAEKGDGDEHPEE
jgi:hypothetical protein